ncbi:hypothetical protein L3V23_05100 [Vibrio sp. A1-b2]|uniref:hypothetical protein n=1 Tax=Vibrio sp. A1-b2 TaxID=2912248 RepID=UPI001F29C587|nr:hypothetical protein [Vibrio sp. A1-b2]MCF7361452.1 hypothetical protein [Vibrio sp. A1-b2]
MKRKWLMSIPVLMATLLLSGCGSTSKGKEVTAQFHIDKINVQVTQFHEPAIEYHSKEELSTMVESLVLTKLADKGMLSDAPGMDTITINIDYTRRFVGDATPIPSDSLGYPEFNFNVQRAGDEPTKPLINRNNLVYKGSFAQNLQVIAGALRDKSVENDFVEAIANTVVNDIEELN